MKEAPSMVPHYIMLSIFFIAGAVCFISAMSNAKWFLNSRNLSFLRSHLSPKWVRIVYGIIGIALMVIALLFYHKIDVMNMQQ